MEEKDRKPTLDEYRGMDGLIRCSLCGKPKQHRYKLWGEERKEKDERLQAERD